MRPSGETSGPRPGRDRGARDGHRCSFLWYRRNTDQSLWNTRSFFFNQPHLDAPDHFLPLLYNLLREYFFSEKKGYIYRRVSYLGKNKCLASHPFVWKEEEADLSAWWRPFLAVHTQSRCFHSKSTSFSIWHLFHSYRGTIVASSSVFSCHLLSLSFLAHGKFFFESSISIWVVWKV